MSRVLSERGIDHVVLERGEIANSWRRERWDSLRLLTPNWQSRLPGFQYRGGDVDGFMTMREVIGFIDDYAHVIGAPVRRDTSVVSVSAADDGFRVVTQRGRWRCRAVVCASGAHNLPSIPALADLLPASVRSLSSQDYRNPEQLDEQGVLIVGASATGVQLADELQRAGRAVTLAVGEHIRMPRVYRGRDIQWWLDETGVLGQRYDAVDDLVRARRVPSPQLVGTPERMTLDLNSLTARGVNIVGRLVGVEGDKAQFSGSLKNHCAMADLKQARLLDTIDAWVERSGRCDGLPGPQRFASTRVADSPRLSLNLAREKIGTVIWATGLRPDYRWLHLPVLDAKGRLRHDGGVVGLPGVYVLGHNFMRRRKSSFIHGAEDDVRELGGDLVSHLVRSGRRGGRVAVG
jgi:putative flavoprotein involved in K+ transport